MTTRSRRRLALALLALISALAAGAIHERDLARRMSSAVVAYFHGAAQPRQFALAAADEGGSYGAAGPGASDHDGSTRHAALAQTQAATRTAHQDHDGGGSAAPTSDDDLFTLGAPAAGPHSDSVQGGSGAGSGSSGDDGASGPAGAVSGDGGSTAPAPGSFGAGIGADNVGGGSSKATASDTSPADGSTSVSSVPEPDDLALMGAGALALLGAALKRKSR